MMGLGWQELLIVLVIIVIIFGAGKIPEVGSALGRGVKDFKVQANDCEPAGPIASASVGRDESRLTGARDPRADQI
ncbi:MAG: twin-arginine translocase TatA/TatE family subunit [Gemmatimonadota bacterium]|nr:twin-arginine translocase TatA/TatE family subunit [Gemmatimonadota bacterium]